MDGSGRGSFAEESFLSLHGLTQNFQISKIDKIELSYQDNYGKESVRRRKGNKIWRP